MWVPYARAEEKRERRFNTPHRTPNPVVRNRSPRPHPRKPCRTSYPGFPTPHASRISAGRDALLHPPAESTAEVLEPVLEPILAPGPALVLAPVPELFLALVLALVFADILKPARCTFRRTLPPERHGSSVTRNMMLRLGPESRLIAWFQANFSVFSIDFTWSKGPAENLTRKAAK